MVRAADLAAREVQDFDRGRARVPDRDDFNRRRIRSTTDAHTFKTNGLDILFPTISTCVNLCKDKLKPFSGRYTINFY